jgi:hypothetical protein
MTVGDRARRDLPARRVRSGSQRCSRSGGCGPTATPARRQRAEPTEHQHDQQCPGHSRGHPPRRRFQAARRFRRVASSRRVTVPAIAAYPSHRPPLCHAFSSDADGAGSRATTKRAPSSSCTSSRGAPMRLASSRALASPSPKPARRRRRVRAGSARRSPQRPPPVRRCRRRARRARAPRAPRRGAPRPSCRAARTARHCRAGCAGSGPPRRSPRPPHRGTGASSSSSGPSTVRGANSASTARQISPIIKTERARASDRRPKNNQPTNAA